jgi:hypothetical protein
VRWVPYALNPLISLVTLRLIDCGLSFVDRGERRG